MISPARSWAARSRNGSLGHARPSLTTGDEERIALAMAARDRAGSESESGIEAI